MGIYTRNKTPYERRTLQDMLVPYLMYTQRYDDIANKLGELGDQSVIWNNLLSPTRDPETWSTVNDYNQRLGDTIYNMQRGNLNLNDALNQLQNMRREYNSWGTAVDNAYKQRQKFVEEQRALALQPGGYHVTRPAESISIDELMANPAASYEALSEKELYDRGKAAADASSKRRFSSYETTRFKNEYNVLVNHQGYSQRDAAKFLADKYNIPELGRIFDNISTEYNLDRFGNSNSIDRIQLDQSIFNGILDGMTGSKTETNFGKIEKPTMPTFDNNGGGKSTNIQMPTIPLSHITQGNAKPTGDVVTDKVWMDKGKVYSEDVVQSEQNYNSIKDEYDDYINAINNYQKRMKVPYASNRLNINAKKENIDKVWEDKGWTIEDNGEYMYRSIKDSYFDENGNLKDLKGKEPFTYNGKTYYPKRLKELQSIIDNYQNNLNPFENVYNQYSYLNQNSDMNTTMSEADVINIGNALNNSILQSKIVTYPYKAPMSNQKNIVNYFNTVLTSENYVPNSELSQNGIFQMNSDGSLGTKITNQPTTTDNAVVIAEDSGNGLQIGFRQNGHDYAWKGDAAINQITQNYNSMKTWLQDFTNEGVGQNSTNGTMYIANTDVNKDDIYNQINGKQGTKIPDTPYYGYVVYDQGSGDVIKIISDTSIFMLPQAQINPNTNKYEISYGSNIIAINTMGSQLSGNSQYMNDYLNDYLQKTFDYIDTWNKEHKE